EAAKTERLWEARLAQARGLRYSGRPGQRFASLRAIREAAQIRVTAELRDEAVGALCLPDIEEGPAWGTACPGAALAFADDPMTYAQADGRGTVYFCRAVDGREQRLAEWPGVGYPPKGVNWLSGDGRFLVASASPQGGPLRLWRRDGDRVS